MSPESAIAAEVAEEPQVEVTPTKEAETKTETPEDDKPLEGLDAFLAEPDIEDLDLDIEEPVVEPEGQKPQEVAPVPVTEEVPLAEPKPEGEVAPTPAPVAEPGPEPTPVVEPVQEAPPTPAEPAPVATPAVPQQTPEEQAAAYTKYRTDAEAVLSTQHYALSEEMANALEEDASKVIPQLMSKVYMDAMTGAINHVMKNMPQLVESAMGARDAKSKQESAFFTSWPQLDAVKHRDTIVNLGQAYRQVHPNAPAEQFIRDVGAQAVVALQLAAPGAITKVDPNAPPSTPVAAPFVPAGSSSPGSSSPAPQNKFEQLNAMFDAEDLDLD